MNWLSKFFTGKAAPPQAPAYDENALIIDIRTPGEFASGHVDGALNLPMDKFGKNYAKLVPDRGRQVIVYCQSGVRSVHASQFLKLQRYVNVINGGTAEAVASTLHRKIV
jgi:phage shock protein E